MGLDYPYTCPDINAMIDSSKRDIESSLSEALEGSIEDMLPIEYKAVLEGEVAYLHGLITDYFETLRNINSDMRDTADRQIEELENRVEELECDLDDMRDQIRDRDL